MITESSPSVCARLIAMLSDIEGISILGYAHAAAEAEPMIRSARPDVVLIGSHAPRWETIRLLRFVRHDQPDTISVILTDLPRKLWKQYIDAGADYGFDKATELDAMMDMLRNIRGVSRGRRSARGPVTRHRAVPFNHKPRHDIQ